jgi:hypothetical protein
VLANHGLQPTAARAHHEAAAAEAETLARPQSTHEMKFDLTPDNRDLPDEMLLEDLRAAAKRQPFGRLTRAAYSELGRFSPATIAARFSGCASRAAAISA